MIFVFCIILLFFNQLKTKKNGDCAVLFGSERNDHFTIYIYEYLLWLCEFCCWGFVCLRLMSSLSLQK